jgi:hypothetical protein
MRMLTNKTYLKAMHNQKVSSITDLLGIIGLFMECLAYKHQVEELV